VLFTTAIAAQIGILPALYTVILLLIGATVIAVSFNFARHTLSRSPEDFMRLQLWTSAVLAASSLPMHLLGVMFGRDDGLFIPETGVTAIVTIAASATAATCLVSAFKLLEDYHWYLRLTAWLLAYSVLNFVLTLPSAFSFITKL
jgi:hypothetical protein